MNSCGEIRLCIEAVSPTSYLWQDLGASARAITMFGTLRVWDTEANNSVLIYLLLAHSRLAEGAPDPNEVPNALYLRQSRAGRAQG